MRTAMLLAFALVAATGYSTDVEIRHNGRIIVLHDDFTWSYGDEERSGDTEVIVLNAGPTFDRVASDDRGKYRVDYDGGAWNVTGAINDDADVSFENVEGTGFGMLIHEGLRFPLESVRDFLVSNAQESGADVRLLEVRVCSVNGTPGELVTYTASIRGLDFTFHSFIASNDNGTVQFTFFTLSSEFEHLVGSFREAIGGLVF